RTASITMPLCISHPRRVGFRQIRSLARPALQRRQRRGGIHVNHRVELLRNPRAEVVTRALRLRCVDDADGALEPRRGKRIPALRRGKDEALETRLVEQMLVTPPDRWGHAPPLGGFIPFSRR